MDSNVINALGPGSKLRSLSTFAQSYQSVNKNFSDLLVFPFLENIKVYDTPNSDQPTAAAAYKSLRALAVDGSSRFASLCSQDIALARQAISYAVTFQPLIEAVDIATFVLSLHDVVKNYADSARANSEQSKKFFSQFASFIDILDNQIDAMSDQLVSLDEQIETQSSELQDQDIGQHLYQILKTVFNLATSIPDAEVQIAALLKTSIDTIRGSFSALFEDRSRLQKIISGLKDMRTQISSLRTIFSSLKSGLTVVTIDSASLLGVWDDVTARLQTVANVQRNASADEVKSLVSAWNKVSADADGYITAINAPTSSSFAVRTAKAMAETPKIPVTKREIQLHRQIAKADPNGQLQARLRTNPAFRQRFVRKQVARVKLATLAATDIPDEDKVKAVISPPDDAQAKLDELATNTGQILRQFDELLQLPFLQELSCTDPDDGKTPSDIRSMVTTFRKRYLDLQQETIPVARDLQTYANTQITILPMVTPNATTDPAQMSLKDFLDMNKGLTADYQTKSNDLFNKSLTYKRSWDNAINSVTKSINECTTNIDTWTKTVDDLTEQEKKATLFGALSIVGAFLCFAAAAFFPGALLGAGALIYTAVEELQKAHRLSEAINDLKARIAIASDTRDKLNKVIPFMQTIATSLTNVTQIWNTIVGSLTNIGAFYTILSGPAGPGIWNTIRPKVSDNWQTVENSCVAYINIVVSG